MYFKKRLLFDFVAVLGLFPFLLASAQIPGSPPEHLKKFVPPDGLWLEGNLFIDKTETANIHWLEYLYFIENDSSLEMKEDAESYDDYLAWSKLGPKAYLGGFSILRNDDFEIDNYFSDRYDISAPIYRYEPVVGITYLQAQNYSRWRSDAVTKAENEKLIAEGSDQRILYKFRLPRPQEWEKAAKTLPITLTEKEDSLRLLPKSLYRFIKQKNPEAISRKEFKQLKAPGIVCDFKLPSFHQDTLLLCKGYNFLNDVQLDHSLGYHFLGNVAEMTSTPGLAKGGSWMHKKEECTIENNIAYDCPGEWLGFRNVCEVFVYNKDSLPPTLGTDVGLAKEIDNCASVAQSNAYLYNARMRRSPEMQAEALEKLFMQFKDTTEYFEVFIGSERLKAVQKDSIPQGNARFMFSVQISMQEKVQVDSLDAHLIDYIGRVHKSFQFNKLSEKLWGGDFNEIIYIGRKMALCIIISGTKDGLPFKEYHFKNIN